MGPENQIGGSLHAAKRIWAGKLESYKAGMLKAPIPIAPWLPSLQAGGFTKEES